jgi:nucleotide-binding universal stress UspA family protein
MNPQTMDTASILLPTDPDEARGTAFAHALKIALKTHRPLSLLQVRESETARHWSGLDAVVEKLVRWRLLEPDARADALERELGLKVASFGVPARTVRAGILDHLESHPCELAVFATHAHKGLAHWLEASLERAALRKAHAMMLFLREGQRGFVDPEHGDLALRKVLLPLDDRIDAEAAVERIVGLVERLAAGVETRLLHVGAHPPAKPRPDLAMMAREGPVTEMILTTARLWSADLIAMPTAGGHGLFGALRGSVTAEVVADARWPVLSVPAN